jgi:hypothetical protein
MKRELLITLSVLVPTLFLVLIGVIVCLVRRLMTRSGTVAYDRIMHELDDEEMEFKQAIEMKNRNGSRVSSARQVHSAVGDDDDDDEGDELTGFDLDDDIELGSKDMYGVFSILYKNICVFCIPHSF